MANLDIQYSSLDYINIGKSKIKLKRFTVTNNPDEVGSLSVWYMAINDLYRQMPLDEFWDGTTIEVWNMDSPDLLRFFQEKKVHLKDFDPNTPGMQTAAELYFMGNSKHVAVGYWNPNPWGVDPLQFSIDVLSHGIGHMHHDICGFKDNESKSCVHHALTDLFDAYRPHQAAGDSYHEDYAETYRALFGGVNVRGTFSDGVKSITKFGENQDYLFAIMRNAFELQNYVGTKEIRFLNAHKNGYLTWGEPIYFWMWVIGYTYKAIRNGETYTYLDGEWRIDE